MENNERQQVQERMQKDFNKAIEKIKSLGFTVYISDDKKSNYGHYTNGSDVGYFQMEYFSGGQSVEISTIHKANRLSGTGFGMINGNDAVLPENLTKDMLELGFTTRPSWAKHTPEKYTLDEWLKTYWNKKRTIKA